MYLKPVHIKHLSIQIVPKSLVVMDPLIRHIGIYYRLYILVKSH